MRKSKRRVFISTFQVLTALLALSGAGYAQGPPSQAAGYSLVFADDFDPLSLSPNGSGNYNWFDGVWFWNPAPLSNISTTDAGLTLTWTANQGSDNTSIETFSTASQHYRTFQYGYFEVVMKWDVVTGAYPAVWLTPIEAAFGEDHYNGVQEQGEFDLFEGQAAEPHTYFGTVHDWKNLVGSANTNNSWQLSSDVDFSQYHKYGMLWVPGKVTWYFDDQPLMSAPTPAVVDKQHYLLVLAMQEGVNWTMGNLSGVTAASMGLSISSVRVWQPLPSWPATRTLAQPLIVQASPNATAGTMTFSVIPGSTGAGGSFNGQSSATVNLDSQGYGTSPLLTANGAPGTFNVEAFDGVSTVQASVTTTPCLNPNSPSVAVTDTTDYNLQNPNSASTGSLRYVLANACAGSTIDLTQLTGDIQLGSRLRIDDNMTITGPGASTLAINGGSSTRLFFIGSGTVSMSGLTLKHALAQGGNSVFGGGGAGMGGAIFMQSGEVTLSNMTLRNNEALGGGSGSATQCTANCLYAGGGFAGDAQEPEQGGSSGDLLGLAGLSNGAAGDFGGGGAAAVASSDSSASGGNGGFGAGGGTGRYTGGETVSGNGGFGGGGAAGYIGSIASGSGGFGGGNGYAPAGTPAIGVGGSGAGFGGAIFEYSGQLTLNGVEFSNNSAVGGTVAGLSGQPAVAGQGKGGALFIYNGAIVIDNGSTFGTATSSNIAASAGLPGNGNSAAPYTSGATCPGQDTVDVCGLFGNPAGVTINVPAGLSFTINSVTYTGSQTLNLPQGQYTLTAPSAQSAGAGSQIAFASWSDGGALSHAITVSAVGLSITGTFTTQYLLTISAGTGGSTAPATSGYYNAGSVVNLNAFANSGSIFGSWSGPVAAASSAATTVTMNGPQTVTANFSPASLVSVAVPLGVTFALNGANYAGPQSLTLAQGQYTLVTSSPQSTGFGGQQAAFSSWSDGGAISHVITVGSVPLSISGSFTTQYQLSTNTGIGGTVSPATGQFYSSGTVVNLTATPNPGYMFHNWTGPVASAYSATTTVTLSQAQAITANFWPAPAACAATPANITAWWTGNGSANDVTTLNNATLGGDVGFAAGLVGQAFSFNGTPSPFVALPVGAFPAQPGNGPFSFETWFQTVGGNGGVILGQQPTAPYATSPGASSPAVYVGTDGNLYVEMFYNGGINPIVGPVTVNDNQWHHVAVTYDGSLETAYLDGASIGSVTPYVQVPNGSPLFYQLGTGFTANYPATNDTWYTFNGLIDEPAVYSRTLSAAEVLSIAQAESYGKCDPVALVSPGALSFPSITEGQNGTLTSQVSNPGNAPLDIAAISLDANDTNFTVLTGNAGDCLVGTPIAAGSSCNVRVQFAPPSAAPFTGQITLTDNALLGGGVQTITLSGAGGLISQTITFASISTQAPNTTLNLTATATSNMSVTYTSNTLAVCAVSGSSASLLNAGTCSITASQSGSGNYAAAQPVTQSFAVSNQTVTYAGLDTSTQGTWGRAYGGDGYLIANEPSALPAYATVSFTGSSLYTWTAFSTDPRALQTTLGASTGIASTYYSYGSFSINVNLTDGNLHRIALYLLDWDSSTRAETITISDATSSAVLDTETYSGFHNGTYAIWNIKGNVTIQVTKTGGANAVVAGLFFGGVPAAISSASYTGIDTLTQGMWSSAYGGDGNLIANEPAATPAYAQVSVSGASQYTWAASTSDPRALKTAAGAATQIASTYYSYGSFTINLDLTDGNVHKIALYMLDWDSTSRSETITIRDALGNTVLDTETYSDFHNGTYAVWNIKGHVTIQVTRTGGSNAVVAGLFFGGAPAAPVTSTASYNGADTVTQGSWTGIYGADGNLIANEPATNPAYAEVSVSGTNQYTWSASTSDPRALETAAGAATQIASTYYSYGTFTINVNLTDGNSHRIALYLLDWDSTTRAETITIRDALTNTILDTETYSGFHNGTYAVWNIKGNVTIQVTKTGGANAVVAGLFFGGAPAAPAASAASYNGADTVTRGSWTGIYGADGNLIANEPATAPAYAEVNVNGANQYTWSASTSDPRALESAAGAATQIASTYYSYGTFTINLGLTDGNVHKIALYLLDWDSTSRSETITIRDALSNAVLDTETYSGFHSGTYALWNIKGHVTIQVTRTGGSNAVVSGVFFN